MDTQLGDVTFSDYDDDGFLGVQINVHGQNPGMVPYEVMAPYGFHSRPLDPIDGKPCSAFFGRQGNQAFAWLATDPIVQPRLPKLKKGETIVYGAAGQFTRYHADGRITHYTTSNNTTEGQAVFLEIGPSGLVFSAPWGKLRFDATGFHLQDRSGARIDLGALAGGILETLGLGSYATLRAGILSLEGSATSQGTAHGAAVIALLADLAAIKTALALGPPNPLIADL